MTPAKPSSGNPRQSGLSGRRRFLLGATASLASMSLSNLSTAQQAVLIGHDAPFEPFGYIENGQSRGMLVEAVGEIFKRMGRSASFRGLALDAIEGALAAGSVDALAFKGVSPERRQHMDFSAPLLVTGGGAFARLGLAAATDLAAYNGMTVVTPERGPLAPDIRRRYPQIKLLSVASYDASLEAVLAGQADVAALNFHVGQRLINGKYPGRFSMPAAPYLEVPLAFAVAKGRNAELLADFERALAAHKADGSLDRLYARWLRG
jgi:polar amino acid transport system substrate-binding protein